jgi:hypothetical protein
MDNRIHSSDFSVYLSFDTYVSSVDKEIQNVYGGSFSLCRVE